MRCASSPSVPFHYQLAFILYTHPPARYHTALIHGRHSSPRGATTAEQLPRISTSSGRCCRRCHCCCCCCNGSDRSRNAAHAQNKQHPPIGMHVRRRRRQAWFFDVAVSYCDRSRRRGPIFVRFALTFYVYDSGSDFCLHSSYSICAYHSALVHCWEAWSCWGFIGGQLDATLFVAT